MAAITDSLFLLGLFSSTWALQILPGPVANPLNPDGYSIAQEVLVGALVPQPPYLVQAGDSLESIATKLHTSVACLEGANPQVSDPSVLCVGESLSVPNSNATIGYAVCPGDTWSSIAKQFGISLTALRQANSEIRLLSVDHVISVPNLCSPTTQSDLFPCGDTFYYLNSYSCFDGGDLCPVAHGIPTYRCGDACYATSMYSCYPGNQLCPVVDGIPYLPCGEACYSPADYSCHGGSLVQVAPGPDGFHYSSGAISSGCPRCTTSSTSVANSGETSISAPTSSSSSARSGVASATESNGSAASNSIPSTASSNTATSVPTGTTSPAASSSGISLSASTITSQPTEIVIGGSTFEIGTTDSTVTVNSQTLVIGPGGIEIGSSTITLPSGVLSTVITSDGLTFTLDEPPPPTASSTSPGGSGPSHQTTGATSESEPANTASFTEIEVGGSTLIIGSLESTVTIGSETIVFGPSGIEINSTPLTLPSVIASDFTTDGITVTVGHGEATHTASSSSGTGNGRPTQSTASSTPTISSTTRRSGSAGPTATSSLTEVEFGGSTFTIGSGTTTVTFGSETVVIGPGGVEINSTPISLPTAVGAGLTTDGITFTVGVVGGGGGVVVGGTVTLETGGFTTITLTGVTGVTTYSSTTTTDKNGHHTIIPVWPCLFPPIPECAIIVEALAPDPGPGDLPPPTCQPVIHFGAAGEIIPIFEGLFGDLLKVREERRRQIAGVPSCVVRFTETQTRTLSDLGGGVHLTAGSFDQDEPGFGMPDNSNPPPTTLSFAPATTVAATATPTCGNAATSPSVVASGDVTLPRGASTIDVFLPVADTPGADWNVILMPKSGADPNLNLIAWTVVLGGGSGFPIAEGLGDATMARLDSIIWATQPGTSRTAIELEFLPQSSNMVFTLTLSASCPPPPPASSQSLPPTSSQSQPPPPPTITGGFWLDSVANVIEPLNGAIVTQVQLVGDVSNSCDAIAQAAHGEFAVDVEDLNGNLVGNNPQGFLFSPGNGFELTNSVQEGEPVELCGIAGNTITFSAAGHGGLTFADNQGTPNTGTCTTATSTASCTSVTELAGGITAVTATLTVTNAWHCSASGNPGYCNS